TERRPVWTDDRMADPALEYRSDSGALVQSTAPRAYLAVPIVSRGTIHGVLVGYFNDPHRFTPREVQLLSTLADQAAIAIDNARLYAEATRRQREAEVLARAARDLSESLDVDAVARSIVERLRELLSVHSVGLRLLQADGSLPEVSGGTVLPPDA